MTNLVMNLLYSKGTMLTNIKRRLSTDNISEKNKGYKMTQTFYRSTFQRAKETFWRKRDTNV